MILRVLTSDQKLPTAIAISRPYTSSPAVTPRLNATHLVINITQDDPVGSPVVVRRRSNWKFEFRHRAPIITTALHCLPRPPHTRTVKARSAAAFMHESEILTYRPALAPGEGGAALPLELKGGPHSLLLRRPPSVDDHHIRARLIRRLSRRKEWVVDSIKTRAQSPGLTYVNSSL